MFQNKERSCLLVGERNREESRGVFGLRRVAESFRKQMGWPMWFQNAIDCQNRFDHISKRSCCCGLKPQKGKLRKNQVSGDQKNSKSIRLKTTVVRAISLSLPSVLEIHQNEFCYKFELNWRLFEWAV
jgi:hypothetical protein